jgi:hypothetical protein
VPPSANNSKSSAAGIKVLRRRISRISRSRISRSRSPPPLAAAAVAVLPVAKPPTMGEDVVL